ncbi:MAG: hypothetical protein MUE60_14985 [Candidatus Eisenbacteria bacterium]|nr:hypothetical protein [Candidatus Eisenbacteria bacterium]
MKSFRNYLLLFFRVVLVLLCFEAVFRVRAWRDDLGRLDDPDDPAVALRHSEAVKLGHMIRMSRNPNLIYERIPDRVYDFKHQVVRIYADGFRGASISHEKRSGTVRILGIGDSEMFGWDVAEKETYLARLSERLNRRYPEVTWEVINAAVPGYNSALEVAALRIKGVRFAPDIVVGGFLANDLNLPNFIRDASALWSFRRSFLFDCLTGTASPLDLIEAPGASQGRGFAVRGIHEGMLHGPCCAQHARCAAHRPRDRPRWEPSPV